MTTIVITEDSIYCDHLVQYFGVDLNVSSKTYPCLVNGHTFEFICAGSSFDALKLCTTYVPLLNDKHSFIPPTSLAKEVKDTIAIVQDSKGNVYELSNEGAVMLCTDPYVGAGFHAYGSGARDFTSLVSKVGLERALTEFRGTASSTSVDEICLTSIPNSIT